MVKRKAATVKDNTKFVKALAQQDWETYDELVSRFEREGKGTPVAIIGHAFTLAAKKRFAAKKDMKEIIGWVAETRQFLLEGRELPPREAEALICAAVDIAEPWVEEIVNTLDTGTLVEIEGQLLIKLLTDEKLSEAELDAFLLEAERQEAEWDRSG